MDFIRSQQISISAHIVGLVFVGIQVKYGVGVGPASVTNSLVTTSATLSRPAPPGRGYNGPCYRPPYGLSTRLFPASASTGSFSSFQSGPGSEIKTLPRSTTTHSFASRAGGCQNGSITSSSQSSDESEDLGGPNCHLVTRIPRRRSGGGGGGGGGRGGGGVYRSSSLPRHSSGGQYKRSITLPDIKSHEERGQHDVQLTSWLQSLTGTDLIPHRASQ